MQKVLVTKSQFILKFNPLRGLKCEHLYFFLETVILILIRSKVN